MSDIFEPKSTRHLEMAEAGTIAKLEAEVGLLKREWLSLHGVERMRFAAIQIMTAEIERLQAENEKLKKIGQTVI